MSKREKISIELGGVLIRLGELTVGGLVLGGIITGIGENIDIIIAGGVFGFFLIATGIIITVYGGNE